MFSLRRRLVQGGRMRPGVHGWGRGITDESVVMERAGLRIGGGV